MEAALRTCCKGIKIGKILVVRHHGQMSRAQTSAPSPYTSAHTTPSQAAAAAAATDGPFNSPRRNQQWQQHNAATEAYRGSSSSSQPGSRPLSATQAAAPAPAVQDNGAPSNDNTTSSSGSIQKPGVPSQPGVGVSPRGSPLQQQQQGGGYSSEGSAFAAALATYGGNVSSACWIQNSTQDVIYEKLPADIADRHCLLMDPVLSTGNSAYTAIEVGGPEF